MPEIDIILMLKVKVTIDIARTLKMYILNLLNFISNSYLIAMFLMTCSQHETYIFYKHKKSPHKILMMAIANEYENDSSVFNKNSQLYNINQIQSCP